MRDEMSNGSLTLERESGKRPRRRPLRVMGDSEDRSRVFIQLTEDQIEAVIGETGSNGAMEADPLRAEGQAPLLAGDSTQWIFKSLLEDRSLSHSLLLGLQVLTCFPLDGTERGVAEVAQQLGMNNSTVHRYMTTLMQVGLLERNPVTRWYRLVTRRTDEQHR